MPHVWPSIEGSGGGGGIRQSYIGTNSIGGNADASGSNMRKWFYKKVSLPSAVLLTNIDVYCSGDASHVSSLFGGVQSDNAGVPGSILSLGSLPGDTEATAPLAGNLPMLNIVPYSAQWVSIPCSAYIAAGTYWLAVVAFGAFDVGAMSLYYAVGGHDFTNTDNNTWFNPAVGGAATDSGLNYSIRASILT